MKPRVVSRAVLAPCTEKLDTIVIRNFTPNADPARGGTAVLLPRRWET